MLFNLMVKLQTNIYAFNCALLLSFIFSSSEAFISNLQPDAVNACAIANCGKGSCQDTDNSSFGFQCDCYSGWNQFQVGSLILPPCIVPNCTLNFDCAGENPSPPTPPEPVFNLSDPCSYTWCGDGSCKTKGSSYQCDCNAGSYNLRNTTTLPCFNPCSLGADCHDLGVGTPPRDHSSSPPGLREIRKVSPIKDSWTLLILGPIFLPLL
ncbi:hypothetical protein ES319_A06G066200v1 [Gossypium barbadense]|uniref:EGF-like domain-containing protein n=3 Tax=Gossypium TaxID=3633 RepID=A0A5J5VAQ2_GOSBA|nr:hypothetical protein ES319_A06G066200v1 [Gossypium barbadense]TYH12510.1 hypothetical protein ES288_A06G073000v1 [Gossypium darwinii]TYI21930.1 hypothetical protein ES332_A06G071700v1 [Gossypium tomentosum]